MLGAAADSLHRCPHVSILGQKVPAGRLERCSLDTAGVIDEPGRAFLAILDHAGPDLVAIAFDHCVRRAKLMRFLGKKSGMDPAVDDAGSALTGKFSYLVSAQRIAGVNPDADYVAGLDGLRIELLQSFVNDLGIAQVGGGSRRQHVEPARRDDAGPKGRITRID